MNLFRTERARVGDHRHSFAIDIILQRNATGTVRCFSTAVGLFRVSWEGVQEGDAAATAAVRGSFKKPKAWPKGACLTRWGSH